MQTLISLYRTILSPITHSIGQSVFGSSFACRFTPTCSKYAMLAIAKYGIIRGGLLSLGRILRCHPWSRTPYNDPLI